MNTRLPAKKHLNKLKRQRKPISHTSRKRFLEQREYKRLKGLWWNLPENEICCVEDCKAEATDLHHFKGRRGPLLILTQYWKPLCRTHHRLVHDNPEWGRSVGLLPAIGGWNVLTNKSEN